MDRFPEPLAEDIRHFPVSVILERRPATSQWVDHVWNAVGITVGRHADSAEAQLVRDEAGTSCYLVGGLEVALYTDECESYYYNLVSDNPRAYVLAHAADDNDQPRPFKVSMSFDEAHAYLEGDDQVYAVDVPPELYRWTEAYVIANYFPEKKRKRKLRDWSADESGGLSFVNGKWLDDADHDETRRPGESFLQRVHRRKTEARTVAPGHVAAPMAAPASGQDAMVGSDAPVEPELTDQDMPPLASLTADSDYSGFLSSKVSEALRRAALRKLFHGTQFNVIDEMDDYAEDFSTFTALGDFITSDMRHALEVETRKQAEALKQALLEGPEAVQDIDPETVQAIDGPVEPESGEAAAARPRHPQET